MTNLQAALGVAQMEELPEFYPPQAEKLSIVSTIAAGVFRVEHCFHFVRELPQTSGFIP